MRHIFFFVFVALICNTNNTKAQFGPQQIVYEDNNVNATIMSSGDLDNDGKLDFATAMLAGVSWFKNLGNNKFSDPNFVPLNSELPIIDLDIVDLNDDNDLDILVLKGDNDQYELVNLINTGNGNFQEILIETGAVTNNLKPVFCRGVDLNKDGKNDIVASLNAYEIVLFKQTDAGVFANQQTIYQSTPLSWDIRAEPSFADIDDDSNIDILIAARSTVNISKFKLSILYGLVNNSNVTFNESEIRQDENFHLGFNAFDVDEDGEIDIISEVEIDDEIHLIWHKGLGSRSFAQGIEIDNFDYLNNMRQIRHVDLDNDGRKDIIYRGEGNYIGDGGEGISWYRNLGFGNYDALKKIDPLHNDYYFNYMVNDFDNDGDLDIVSGFGPNVKLSENNGSGEFNNKEYLNDELTFLNDVKVADLDNDFDNDIVVFSDGRSRIAWFENDGNASFRGPHNVSVSSQSGSWPWETDDLALKDIDGDSDIDIISRKSYRNNTSEIKDSIHIFLNNGLGAFNPIVIPTERTVFFDIDAFDMDYDGDIDILFDRGNQLYWIENLGNNQFAKDSSILIAEQNITYFKTSDINKDGRIDILFESDNRVYWINNTAGSNFLDVREATPTNFSHDLYKISGFQPIDVDEDGDEDIVASVTMTDFSHHIWWYENMGNEFSFRKVYKSEPNMIGFKFVSSFDFNNDLKEDVIVGFGAEGSIWNQDSLFWYANLDGSNVGDKMLFTDNVDGITGLSYGDLDGDSDRDVISTSQSDNHLAIYKNNNPINDQPFIKSMVFHDSNQNGIKESNENIMGLQQISIEPSANILYPQHNGLVYFYGIDGGSYNIAWHYDPLWTLTTDSTYMINFPDDNDKTYFFGLTPSGETTYDLETQVSNFDFLCNFESQIYVTIKNNGNYTVDANISLEIDPLLEYRVSTPNPLSINDNNYTYRLFDIAPNQSRTIKIFVKVPDESFSGDTTEIKYVSSAVNGNGELINSVTDYSNSIIRCAIDPNDKLVDPLGYGEESLVLKDDPLYYTIRFQNTGNFPATNVSIVDTLNTNLDLSTFSVINSSHNVQTSLNVEDRVAIFDFNNIQLPDSLSDPEGSQGYVTFRIFPIEGLIDSTVISNKAYIFFDLNAPIITNATSSTLVDELPIDFSTSFLQSNVNNTFYSIWPNPTTDFIYIEIENLNIEYYNIVFTDMYGRQVLRFNNLDNEMLFLNCSKLNSGMYSITLYDTKNNKPLHSQSIVVLE